MGHFVADVVDQIIFGPILSTGQGDSNFLSVVYGQNSIVTGISMIMAFVFIAGFSVAFAVFLILNLEKVKKSDVLPRRTSGSGRLFSESENR